MNAVITRPAQQQALTVSEVREHKNLIAQVTKSVMQENVHYGVIPGTDKPSLYQQGADCLLTTFRIAPSFKTEDLSTPGVRRFRVTCVGMHQLSGLVLGEGIGECSSAEEKYKWRRAVCDEEFDETAETHRRVKFVKKGSSVYRNKQIRVDEADASNTVLKMAAKRAKVAMTLNVTGASDFFTQDIEDIPVEMRPDHEGDQAARAEIPEGAQPIIDKLREASEQGMEALTDAFNKVPPTKLRTWVWTNHGLTLKNNAKTADANRQPKEPA